MISLPNCNQPRQYFLFEQTSEPKIVRDTIFHSPLASDQDPFIDAKTSGPRYLDIDTWLIRLELQSQDFFVHYRNPHIEGSLCSTAIGDGNRFQLQTPIQLPQHLGLLQYDPRLATPSFRFQRHSRPWLWIQSMFNRWTLHYQMLHRNNSFSMRCVIRATWNHGIGESIWQLSIYPPLSLTWAQLF